MTPTISLIRGDGIGPEIAAATVKILEAAGAKLSWDEVPGGLSAIDSDKDPLPARTLESLRKHRVALKGPLGTPIGGGFKSVNVALRQEFDLYANVRPCKTIPGVPCRYTGVDLVIVRENTEDLYAGIEHYVGPKRDAAESILVITRIGSTRIAEYAFEYAKRHGRKKVSVVHKANILKMSNGLFLECTREVAKRYPDIKMEEVIVDACCMKLVVAPEKFDVIVTTNMFGDIMSDLTAGLIGGLGVAPGSNIGVDAAIFEAVHGTAPDIAGQGIANPTGLTLAAAMMLDHLDQRDAAARVRRGVHAALGDDAARTGDLGGRGNTKTFTDAVIAKLG